MIDELMRTKITNVFNFNSCVTPFLYHYGHHKLCNCEYCSSSFETIHVVGGFISEDIIIRIYRQTITTFAIDLIMIRFGSKTLVYYVQYTLFDVLCDSLFIRNTNAELIIPTCVGLRRSLEDEGFAFIKHEPNDVFGKYLTANRVKNAAN